MELEKGEEIKNLKMKLQVSEENHEKTKETLYITKEKLKQMESKFKHTLLSS